MSRILTIDDRPINRQFLVSLLGYGGHTVLEASDGEEALDIVREKRPDLVIADIKMPNMDGYEFVDRLRQDQSISSTPVIFYTASYHEKDARAVADAYRVIDVITKPAEPEQILKKVNDALGLGTPVISAAGAHQEATDHAELEQLRSVGLKLAALVELGMEIGFERDTEKLLSRFCSSARHITGARKSMLGIVPRGSDEVSHFFINGLKDSQPILNSMPPANNSLLATVLEEKRPLRINGPQSQWHLNELSPYASAIRSLLCVPLVSATEVYGWLLLLEKQSGEEFMEQDERMAMTLAAQAAVAYENSRFSAELDKARLQQLEMKDQFISHVSHELRSPLAALHQFTSIVLDGIAGEINAEQKEYLEIALRNAGQLRDMIGDLLDVTRADAGKLTFEPESLDVCVLFRPVLQSYERRAADRGIKLHSACAHDLPRVLADPNRLRQIFSNLLDNALKFTSAGSISVSAEKAPEPGFVQVSIRDTGCGIADENLNRVFDRLYQLPHQTLESRKGLGLGLHICRQLVQMHGGRLWVESRLGEGATFLFTLPVSSQTFTKGTIDVCQKQDSHH